ncbi:MAG: exo-alpha-sialidase [Bryobacteraceae bacterium]
MTRRDCIASVAGLLPALFTPPAQAAAENATADWRNIPNGWPIPRENYSDQPYVVITRDGHWLCVLTTGNGVEGKQGQHIVSTISTDRGRTWSPLVDIEPAGGPEASWVMPLIVPSGRIYVFYTYNADNLRLDTKSTSATYKSRVDTQGRYAFKYSGDGGRTWSRRRFYIPMRLMRIDRENAYAGKRLYFWGVGKPIITRHGAMFGFAKVGKWGDPGGMVTSQGCFMRSANVLTESDPEKIRWDLLPEGDNGLRAPKGPVADEANLVELSDGSLYATYRTIDGYNCHAYSRDAGNTWTPPAYATYTPGGRRIKHPCAANFVKKFSNGKYLLWFHNHAGEAVFQSNKTWPYYMGRNPAWIAGGVEKNGFLHWSQPEILLYDVAPDTRTSYPDFVEDHGEFFVTETIKTFARVHPIDRTLLEGVWNQFENRTAARRGLVTTVDGSVTPPGSSFAMPRLRRLSEGGGFTLEFRFRLSELTGGQILLDARTPAGKGILVATTDRFTLNLTLNDGVRESSWDSDPGDQDGTLRSGVWQHVIVIVDGGPRIISFVIDGVFNDGGAVRDYGWGRFDSGMDDVNCGAEARFAPAIFGQVKLLRIYDRYLTTSEAVGNWRAGL